MPLRLDGDDADFASRFRALVSDRRDDEADVVAPVAAIIADVRARGDAAVRALTERFDRIDLDALGWAVTSAEIEAAVARCPREVLAALDQAAARIRAFHLRQRPHDGRFDEADGTVSGWRWSALDAVGLYVPGGRASYPSSVLMNAIPAQVAGVGRLVMVTPTPDGRLNPLVLAAARLCGIDTVLRIGGAQAIAALAYGTARVPAVDKIVGPGNAYVAEAKRQVFGEVGIDMIAGPSEILVIADADNDPAWIAADLLSQAEHDPAAQSILITDSARLADAVIAAVDRQLQTLPTAATARASWERYGTVITLRALDQAPALADALAAEHVELCVADPAALFARLRHAGSVFLGRHTPEAIGDYIGGPNHVLPTGRRARFSSGLGVHDFMKRTTFLHMSPAGLASVGPAAVTLAQTEALPAHALSVQVRLQTRSGSD